MSNALLEAKAMADQLVAKLKDCQWYFGHGNPGELTITEGIRINQVVSLALGAKAVQLEQENVIGRS